MGLADAPPHPVPRVCPFVHCCQSRLTLPRGIGIVLLMERMQTTTTHRRETGRKEGLMTSTASSTESQVREFAREFPTPNVQRAVALCEAGTLTWAQVHEIFKRSLAQGLSSVAS
jgi:hypothetical protein